MVDFQKASLIDSSITYQKTERKKKQKKLFVSVLFAIESSEEAQQTPRKGRHENHVVLGLPDL